MSDNQIRVLNRFLRGLFSYLIAGAITYVSANYISLVKELVPNQGRSTVVLAIIGGILLAADKYRRDKKAS